MLALELKWALTMRLLIVGNSGSGKSTLAERIGSELRLPIHGLDDIHWHSDGSKREEAQARVAVSNVAAESTWVLEGVYGWLADVAMQRATGLVWLDLPWADCRRGLLGRGLRRGMMQGDQDALLAWARDYWTRTTSSSFSGHERLYAAFNGPKWRLRSRSDVSAFSLTL